MHLSLALLLSSALSSHAKPVPSYGVCAEAVQALLKTEKVTGEWMKRIGPERGASAFRSPTFELGKWIEVQTLADGTAKVFKLQANEGELRTFAKDQCALRPEKIAGAVRPPQPGRRYFTDADLAKLLESTKPGILYIWSPGMVYSMRHYQVFKETAKKLGIGFQALMEPSRDRASARQLADFHKMPAIEAADGQERRLASDEDPRVASVELLMRNVSHYPMTLVYGQGVINERPITGVLSAKDLEREVSERLAFIGAAK